jgi:hypothetical protein
MTKKAEVTTVPVSVRALTQRINRVLAKDNEILKTSRGNRTSGVYFTVNLSTNGVSAWGIDDLEAWTRKELPGVLQPWEHLEGAP